MRGKGVVIADRSRFRGIYGIVDRAVTSDPLALVRTMVASGIQIVQYRAKSGVDRQLVRAMHAHVRDRDAVLIVNDDLECALEADGWHAGQEDLASHGASDLRARLGTRVFGISCGVASEARVAERLGADYVGVGPFAATASKDDAGEAIGETGIRRVALATRLPVVAIGGIDAANLPGVARGGAAMAAVISAIARAPDPGAAARDLVARWNALVP